MPGTVQCDTRRVRRLADELDERATDLDQLVRRLRRRVEDTPWTGLGGSAFRADAEAGLRMLRRSARAHEDAAGALRRHATRVDERRAAIAAVEAWFADALDAARSRAAALAERAVDGLDDAADAVSGAVTGTVDRLGDVASLVTGGATDPVADGVEHLAGRAADGLRSGLSALDQHLLSVAAPPTGDPAWLDLGLPVPGVRS